MWALDSKSYSSLGFDGGRKGLGPNPSSTAVRESLTPGKLSPMSVVPDSINRPPYAVGKGKPPVQSNQPEIQVSL